ncbi:hypothetical protein [Terrabacter sp. C0L_2]|uniref:hypothetical protein n=1 Tax=Terrabacter sp. C0L_2 TaxID=3108389 RepID=UPI002ED43A1A|nr:hypothetical protein U5C87_00085 [Terrabacter sp. C0L_2]
MEAVAAECRRSSATYADLASIEAAGWLGQPVEISDEIEILQVEGIRKAVFGGAASRALDHLGEAQTIHIIRQRADFCGSTWISDDREALRVARLQGIPVRETQHLVAEAVQWGLLGSAEAGYSMLQQMIAEDQHPALPPSAGALLTL